MVQSHNNTGPRGLRLTLKPNTLYLFVALIVVSLLIILSSLSLLPPHNEYPDSHPLSSALQPVGDSAGENASDRNYHMVFSTACSPFQNWQAYMFFYHAWKVGQRGTVTRLASGCKPDQREEQQKVFDEMIAPLSSQFHIHFTPDFSGPDKVKYFNKPFGLLHWMKESLGYPKKAHLYETDIIMILDPDMMLLKPLTHVFSSDQVHWHTPPVDNVTTVREGYPFAQLYGFANQWLTSLGSNVSFVVGKDSPVHGVSYDDAAMYYPAGPPYLATAGDMYRIATSWTEFLPRVHQVFPEFMAEMHAYSTAAAHLKLPHLLARSFMVSDVGTRKLEGWGFLDDVSRQDACGSTAETLPKAPFVFHYCQRYAVGKWFVGKYKLREDFFTCEAPLLREPPRDVAARYNWWIFPNEHEMVNYTKTPSREQEIVQHGWAMCKLIASLNEVATYYKEKHCDQNSHPNLNKVEIFHKKNKFEEFLEHGSFHGYGN